MKNRYYIAFLAILFFVNLVFAQYTENIDLYISGGGTSAQESIVGKTFEFPQLSSDLGVDFYTEFLRQSPNAENIQDYWNLGFNIGGGLIYHISSILALSTDFNYNQFAFNKDQLSTDIGNTIKEIEIDSAVFAPYNPDGLSISQGNLHIYEVSINLRAQLPLETFRPYAIGGVGYMHVNQEVININYYDDYNLPPVPVQDGISFYDQIPGASYNAIMANAGIGLAVKLGQNFQPFIQANYVVGLTEDNNTVTFPLKFGFIFTL